MKGNFQVRFLGGKEGENPLFYPATRTNLMASLTRVSRVFYEQEVL